MIHAFMRLYVACYSPSEMHSCCRCGNRGAKTALAWALHLSRPPILDQQFDIGSSLILLLPDSVHSKDYRK